MTWNHHSYALVGQFSPLCIRALRLLVDPLIPMSTGVNFLKLILANLDKHDRHDTQLMNKNRKLHTYCTCVISMV